MSFLPPTTLIQRVDDLLMTDVDGETVLMHVERGQYYGLAQTAQSIWNLLERPMSFQELCQRLQSQYKGGAERIESDTQRFVQQMADESLIVLR